MEGPGRLIVGAARARLAHEALGEVRTPLINSPLVGAALTTAAHAARRNPTKPASRATT